MNKKVALITSSAKNKVKIKYNNNNNKYEKNLYDFIHEKNAIQNYLINFICPYIIQRLNGYKSH